MGLPLLAMPLAVAVLAPAASAAATGLVHDLGPARPSLPVTLALTLRYRHERELDALAEQVSDPHSPQFEHFLTSAQFNAYFAPDAGTYARVASVLTHAGFRVRTYTNRTVVDATAGAATVERTFSTHIHAVDQLGHGRHYTNATAATLPPELSGVDSMVGFDDLVKAKFGVERGRAGGIVPDAIGGKLRGPDGGYGPLAIARGFAFPVQYGYDGAGHSVANVAGNMADADLSAFLKFFNGARTGGLTRTIVQGTGGVDPSDPAVQEATLDVETIGSLAPGANIDLYILENPIDQPGEDAYNAIVSSATDDVVNSPYGVCERTDKAYAMAAAKIVKQGVVKGITFVAGSGDSGSRACSTNGIGQNAPAVIPEVTAVGGTSYYDTQSGQYNQEFGWSGSGGGVSSSFKIPSFQIGVAGLASLTHRNVPDVALPADPYHGVSYYLAGQWAGPLGGTSWSSSIFAALQVEVNDQRSRRSGNVNPLIYSAFAGSGYAVFRDIVYGSNGTYSAAAGYDNVTGIGSIRGEAFAKVE